MEGVSLQWPSLASSKVCGKRLIWEAFVPYLDPMDSACLRSASTVVESAKEVRAAWRALFRPDSEGAGDGAGQ